MDPTPGNIEGPFYRGPSIGYDYAPDRYILTPPGGGAGKELELNLKVKHANGSGLSSYVLEIWQCDGNGIYDLSNTRDPLSYLEFWPNTAFYRTTRHVVGAKFHAVWTVVPIFYVDSGGTFREPHIHVKVSVPNGNGLDEVLTTQLFPPRAPNAPPTEDPYYDARNTITQWIDLTNRVLAYFTIVIP